MFRSRLGFISSDGAKNSLQIDMSSKELSTLHNGCKLSFCIPSSRERIRLASYLYRFTFLFSDFVVVSSLNFCFFPKIFDNHFVISLLLVL